MCIRGISSLYAQLILVTTVYSEQQKCCHHFSHLDHVLDPLEEIDFRLQFNSRIAKKRSL